MWCCDGSIWHLPLSLPLSDLPRCSKQNSGSVGVLCGNFFRTLGTNTGHHSRFQIFRCDGRVCTTKVTACWLLPCKPLAAVSVWISDFKASQLQPFVIQFVQEQEAFWSDVWTLIPRWCHELRVTIKFNNVAHCGASHQRTSSPGNSMGFWSAPHWPETRQKWYLLWRPRQWSVLLHGPSSDPSKSNFTLKHEVWQQDKRWQKYRCYWNDLCFLKFYCVEHNNNTIWVALHKRLWWCLISLDPAYEDCGHKSWLVSHVISGIRPGRQTKVQTKVHRVFYFAQL